MTTTPIFTCSPDDGSVSLYSPTLMPNAGGFLWNKAMMIQMNCRGYAVAQHMQPEPAKYAYAPNIEGKTFMQPEHHYYAHHPGRFFYIKDEETGELFSLPHEPVRKKADNYQFTHRAESLEWSIRFDSLVFKLKLKLLGDRAAEQWTLDVINQGSNTRKLSLYPYFTIGYMSWMNQSATFDPGLKAIVATCVTPYQKAADLKEIQSFKDLTYFYSSKSPDAWLAQQSLFEGEGGLQKPDALAQELLPNTEAHYEVPAAVMQYRLSLKPEESQTFDWLFGPAKDRGEIEQVIADYLTKRNLNALHTKVDHASLSDIKTPDQTFNHFVNCWLPRQVSYHGESNRLTTDPQTRNFLQDSMGMVFLDAPAAKQAFLTALVQQSYNGAMPDGILLHPDAKLKYINTVPHSDHNVWLVIFLSTYLQETGDIDLLNISCAYSDEEKPETVFEHIQKAMNHLITHVDERSLSYIYQGDWCDPMNMVGLEGRGVSAWLTLATAYVCRLWADICLKVDERHFCHHWSAVAQQFNDAINQHCWDGQWYGRGITDNGRLFGIAKDTEARIYLNPQTWSILSGAADAEKTNLMLEQIDKQLDTPYGPMLLAPSYTAFQQDIGRLTQKSAGAAENGSVYNHASAFYIYSLYQIGEHERAFDAMRKMLVDENDALIKGQLPVYIPNYYRGAYYQYPRTAGKSSQLFNTGTVAWYYRSIVEGLFGLKGHSKGLEVSPQLPEHWDHAGVTRQFRGATFNITYHRSDKGLATSLVVNGKALNNNIITDIQPGESYQVEVSLPDVSSQKVDYA